MLQTITSDVKGADFKGERDFVFSNIEVEPGKYKKTIDKFEHNRAMFKINQLSSPDNKGMTTDRSGSSRAPLSHRRIQTADGPKPLMGFNDVKAMLMKQRKEPSMGKPIF